MSYLINPYTVAPAVPSGNIYSPNAVLLLSGAGANNSTTFTDESPALHGNATVIGNTHVDTGQLGGHSIRFDGAGDALTYADHADWDLNGASFTIEILGRFASVGTQQFIAGQWDNSGNSGWIFFIAADGVLWFTGFSGNVLGSQFSPAANTDFHAAFDWNGSRARVFKDGVLLAGSNTSITLPNSPLALSIGAGTTGAESPCDAWLKFRLTKGTSLYASDTSFTPPTYFPNA